MLLWKNVGFQNFYYFHVLEKVNKNLSFHFKLNIELVVLQKNK